MADYNRMGQRKRKFFINLAHGIDTRRRGWRIHQAKVFKNGREYLRDRREDDFIITSDSIQGIQIVELITRWRRNTVGLVDHKLMIAADLQKLQDDQDYADVFWTWVLDTRGEQGRRRSDGTLT